MSKDNETHDEEEFYRKYWSNPKEKAVLDGVTAMYEQILAQQKELKEKLGLTNVYERDYFEGLF